jgi:predicted amidohydrolase
MPNLKIALCQMKTVASPAENLAKAEHMIALAAGKGARLVVLPEIFIAPYVMPPMREVGKAWYKTAMTSLGRAAKKHGIFLVGGSLPEPVGKHLYNSAPVFNPKGTLIARHRKVHLFSVNAPSVKVREADVFEPGSRATMFDCLGFKVGVAVCFDVRFPEFMQCYGSAGADLLCVPAAFTQPTGQGHWHVSMRSRAIDLQAYVAACSPAPNPSLGFIPYGHSMLVDPWGEVLAEAGESEKVVFGIVDRERIRAVRERLPIQKSRRPGIY